MKRVVSGVTATGKLTLGNYLGAIKNFVTLQTTHELFIFVADLHALTIDIEPKTLRENRHEIMAIYLAAGINPKTATLFFQSDVLAHGTMNWILENQTTLGVLERMTQFKDKAKVREANGTETIRTGLLTYPTLMAGDILLYKPSLVPVGQDQKQHLELTRDIADRFNKKYGPTLIVPEFYAPKIGAKILSLTDPSKKMSKSDANLKSAIFLTDDPEVAYQKIQKAVTDSEGKVYVDATKPGVTNLLTIYAALKNLDLKVAEAEFKNRNYGEFKQAVGLAVKAFLTDLQSKIKSYQSQVDAIAKEGATKANLVANQTLTEVMKKMGLK